jgi:hypothetical protein
MLLPTTNTKKKYLLITRRKKKNGEVYPMSKTQKMPRLHRKSDDVPGFAHLTFISLSFAIIKNESIWQRKGTMPRFFQSGSLWCDMDSRLVMLLKIYIRKCQTMLCR